MGQKLESALVTRGAEHQPGPGNYNVDTAKKGNFQFSMGAKLGSAILAGNKTKVPGPGNYNHDAQTI